MSEHEQGLRTARALAVILAATPAAWALVLWRAWPW